jgi:hypothetical protein
MKTNSKAWSGWGIDAAWAAALAGLTLAAFVGGVQPLIRSHEEVMARRSALAVQQAQAAKLENALVAAQGRLESTRRALTKDRVRLQPASKVNAQLSALAALAADHGLQIDGIRPEAAAEGACYKTVPIALAGSGTFVKCTEFLRRLRETHMDTYVPAIAMDSRGTGDGSGAFRFVIHWYAEAGEPAK